MAKNQKKRYIAWIYRKIKKRLPVLLLMSALNMAVAYANIRFALTTRTVVNSAISGDIPLLKGSALFLIGLCLFRMLGNTLSQFLSVNVHENLERDFKFSILNTILHSDYSRISRHHSGDLIQRMDSDAASVINGVMDYTAGLASTLTGLIAAVVALLQVAPQFTILCGAAMALLTSTSLLLRNVLKRLSSDSSAANGKVRGFLHESVSRLMLIQALDLSEEMQKRTGSVLDERWKVRRKWRNLSIVSKFGSNMVGYLSYLFTLLWGAAQLLSGRISYGDMTAVISLVSTVRSSAMGLPHMIPRVMGIMAACDRIMELEELPQQPDPDAQKVRAVYGSMTGFTASDLCFSYDREPIMRHVSLTVPKDGLTVIVGPSGIGKSTLLKLLLGLYRPDSGSLVIDTAGGAIPVDRSTRSLFCYAPQGNFLLSGTLRENLTYTNPQATDEQIREALYVSAMDEYVASLPMGLETVLMENGAGLSEGQAQRISLARAIVSGAPVLLLDEVTSALDAATEKLVLERICALPGKTCIAVTHRPAALKLAKRIIEVSETGMTVTEW